MSRSGEDLERSLDPTGRDEVHLADYVQTLLKYRWLVAGATLAGLVFGLVQNTFAVSIYQASAKVLVADPVSGAPTPGDQASSVVQKKLQILLSIPVAEEVYRRFYKKEPDRDPAIDPRVTSATSRLKEIIDPALEGQIKDPEYLRQVLDVRNRVTAHPLGNASILQISAMGPDPAEIVGLVNTYARVFEKKSLELKNYEARKANVLLTANLQAAEQELLKAEAKLTRFQKDSDLPGLDQRLSFLTQKKTIEVTEELRNLDGEMRMLQATGGATTQDNSRERALAAQAQVRTAQTRLDDLLSRFTPEHPAVVDAQAALDRAQTAARSAGGSSAVTSKPYKLLQLKKEELLRKKKIYDEELSKLMDIQSQFALLKREQSAAEQIYKMLLVQQKEATIKEALEVSDVRLIEPAFVPSVPVLPDRGKNVIQGVVVGLLAGLLLALLLEQFDRTLRTKDEILEAAGLPALGVVLKNDDVAAGATLSQVAALDQNSPTTEAIRSLRTAIKHGYSRERDRAFLVTSASPGEGKTTIATNLAISLAQIGERVLLVDSDLRKPRIHKVFSLDNDLGLSNGLSRSALDLARPTGVERLSVITAGPPTDTSAELLFSERVTTFIEDARRSYDRLIFDSPPVNAVTDACVLASRLDGVVFVVRAGKNNRGTLRTALDTLATARCRFLGVVINGLGRHVLSYGDYYYSRYYRDHGEREKRA